MNLLLVVLMLSLLQGISYPQFNKKKQQLENPFTLFDGVQNTFALSFLGTPVAPPSAEHLIVIAYNTMMGIPNVDYYVEGLNLRFNEAPRDQIGLMTQNSLLSLIWSDIRIKRSKLVILSLIKSGKTQNITH